MRGWIAAEQKATFAQETQTTAPVRALRRRTPLAAALTALLLPAAVQAGRWYELNLPGHRIYFQASESAYALAVSEALAHLNAIDARYGYTKPDATSWVLYDDSELFNGSAFTLLNHIELYGTSADFDTRGFGPWVPNVMAHEYAHLASIALVRRYPQWLGGLVLGGVEDSFGKTRTLKLGASVFLPDNRAPRWFKEGIAQYDAELLGHDSFDSTRRMLERAAVLDQAQLTWDEMATVVGKSTIEAELVYNQGYSFTRYLGERFGPETLVDLSRNNGSAAFSDFATSLERTYGIPAATLFTDWQTMVRARAEADLARLPLAATTAATQTWWQEGPFVRYAVVSPEGSRVAFVADGDVDAPSDSLVVAPVSDPAAQTPLLSGSAGRPAWHPTGATIYTAVERNLGRSGRSTYDLRAVDADGSHARWLTRGARVRWPAVHPSGATIAVAQRGPGSWDLALTTPDGGSLKRVTQLPWGWQLRELVYDRNGTLYGVLARDDDLDLFRMPGGDPTRTEVLDWPGSHEQAPTPGPDGRLWFTSDRYGSWQVFALNTTTATAQLMSAHPVGMLAAAPLSDAVIVTVFSRQGWRLDYMPLDARGMPAQVTTFADLAPLAATWTTLVLPRSTTTTTALGTRARFRPGPVLVYPEFQYQFGAPAGGAVVAFSDERRHHGFEAGGVFGRFVDVGASYRYTGLKPTLGAEVSRYRATIPISLVPGASSPSYAMPFVWDNLGAEVFYDPADRWLLGVNLDIARIRFQDDLDVLGVGGPWDRLRRATVTLQAYWADIEPRARHDIDFRGKLALLTVGFRNSRSLLPEVAATGSPFLASDTVPHPRLTAAATWAGGRNRFSFEAAIHLGWIDRDVDNLDEFFAGGTLFSVRRGVFQSFTNMPGYDEFAITGEKLALVRLAQRTTLWTDMGAAGPWLLDALVLELGVEAGNAWPHGANAGDIVRGIFGPNHFARGLRPLDGSAAATDPRFIGLLYDVYVDVRLKAIMFDAFPWNSFFRLAHGFQDQRLDATGVFQNADNAVRIYLGLGTGF